jgi:flagellin-like protein
MNLTSLLIAVLVVVLLGSVPAWPHSRTWGYGPSGIVGALLAILIVLALVRPI